MISIKGALSSVTVHLFAILWWQVVATYKEWNKQKVKTQRTTRSRTNTLKRVLTKSIFCYGDFSQINLSSASKRTNPLKTGFWRCTMQITIAIKVRCYQ
ncbi:hypothetical protein T4D_12714 [Trichinella pseudospiralis]|uniref:Uncharacterized protein n=1 Tax=Trichinella pseudospiralis TaxID=6337 RepID=A0A0V1FEA8_TRIPS|nr:hypothetical protein T4D_12714 [Trichinella pseudospiralis]